MFKKSATLENLDGNEVMSLNPGIYVGTISAERSSKDIYGSDETEPAIALIFKDKETGKKHRDLIIAPKDEDKAPALFEKLLHVLSRIVDEATLVKIQEEELSDFDSLIDWFVKHMANSSKVPVEVKIVGSVYNGNAISKFGNFSAKYPVPFIQRVGSGKTVAFTKKEAEDNAKFMNKVNGVSSEAPTEDNLFA